MNILATAAVLLVALLHVLIMILEMLLWTKGPGRKVFRLSAEFAQQTRVLAANQGLYNGFLAAGLFWGCWLGAAGFAQKVFFLSCVLVAGIFGACTAGRKILWIQAAPAAIALGLLLLSRC